MTSKSSIARKSKTIEVPPKQETSSKTSPKPKERVESPSKEPVDAHSPDQSPTDSLNQHRSPYYYGDLFNKPPLDQLSKTQPKYRKSISLDVPAERSRTTGFLKRNSLAGDGETSQQPSFADQPVSLAADHQQQPLSPTAGENVQRPIVNEILSSCIITEWDHTLMPPHRLLTNDLPGSVCTCVASPDDDDDDDEEELELPRPPHQERPTHQPRKSRRNQQKTTEHEQEDLGEEGDDEEEMARQRHLYETAFDCKVNRSDDDLDDFDRVTNHPVLHSQVRFCFFILISLETKENRS